MRSHVLRIVLSLALFAVAVAGIIVQARLIRVGLVGPTTRLVLAGYIIVALYAGASVAVRLGSGRFGCK